MKILLFGANGQLGWQLRRSLAPLGDVTALAADSRTHCGDLRQPAALVATIDAVQPDVVVNAAAYTAVDHAEDDAPGAYAINSDACRTLAAATAARDTWLVHYSTDYVYDGSGTKAWSETDATGPLSVYGKSKLGGDLAIGQLNPRHLIFRTSWIFETWGHNFVKSILKAAMTRDELNVVADQWGAPTRAALVADVTAHAVAEAVRSRSPAPHGGLYHLAAGGATNWHAYACLVVEQGLACGLPLRMGPDRVKAIPTSAYPVRAKRPGNSRLDTTRLRTAYGIALPQWEEGVRAVVAELASQATFLKG